MARRVYASIDPNEWFMPEMQAWRFKCCGAGEEGCDLVHIFHFKIVRGQLLIRIERDERSTAAARRQPRTKP